MVFPLLQEKDLKGLQKKIKTGVERNEKCK